ncbi:transmembrane component [Liquorilactobacillus sucicola DSM 21376 = JCM 15457]|nr:energy-coupling factor transporter transmembrane component T [Liquorilactobacillus sucicola]GAJ25791.1 transmembrane component [Liquorilactobacillus sucicola DSM 21376 = JCM 15457]
MTFKKIDPFFQILTFVLIISLTFFVSLTESFVLALFGVAYLFIQGAFKPGLKYLCVTLLTSLLLILILRTTNTYIGLLGWLITILFKLLPTMIFGVSLGLIPINELRSVMASFKIPNQLQMALIVGLRYFAILSDELHEIRQARLTHGLSFRNPIYFRRPLLIMDYYLVPTLMRTTKLIDDLSVAAYTEG